MNIPYDGPIGSGVLRTGPLKIGDDWTGVFIRGDEAMGMADELEMICKRYDVPCGKGSLMRELIILLRSCRE